MTVGGEQPEALPNHDTQPGYLHAYPSPVGAAQGTSDASRPSVGGYQGPSLYCRGKRFLTGR
jgi:hypothetical protein